MCIRREIVDKLCIISVMVIEPRHCEMEGYTVLVRQNSYDKTLVALY